MPPALFPLGAIVVTPGASEIPSHRLAECLRRHATGDWGSLEPEDLASNDAAATGGGRILSAYPIDPAKHSAGHGINTLWVISERDRSVTTFLLPEEY